MTTSTLHEPTFATAAGQADAVRPLLGEMLVQAGKLSPRDLERALQAQQEMGSLIGQVLVQLGLVSEMDLMQTLARQLQIPFTLGTDFPPESIEVPGLLPEFQHAQHVFPLKLENGVLDVAMTAPQDPFVIKALQMSTGLVIISRPSWAAWPANHSEPSRPGAAIRYLLWKISPRLVSTPT